jgi:hypothetical protein
MRQEAKRVRKGRLEYTRLASRSSSQIGSSYRTAVGQSSGAQVVINLQIVYRETMGALPVLSVLPLAYHRLIQQDVLLPEEEELPF